MQHNSSIGWPAHGPIGAGRAVISTAPKTRRPISTRPASCWPNKWRRPIVPQWFNTGLYWAYGIDGPSQGHHYVDYRSGKLTRSKSAYEHPQPHACFIQSISDDLVNDGGIMDLWTREARLFKYGSGTGTNFSTLRGSGEPLSGGGKSSGLMSFLKSATARRARLNRAAPRGVRRKWSWSMSIIPISKNSSTGRCLKSRRSRRW